MLYSRDQSSAVHVGFTWLPVGPRQCPNQYMLGPVSRFIHSQAARECEQLMTASVDEQRRHLPAAGLMVVCLH